METRKPTPQTIDDYIAGFPPDVQETLQQVRARIKAITPDAEEAISYAIPTFKRNGKAFIYFSGYKKHIGLYPAPTGVEEFQEEIKTYGSGKGTLRFPLDKPIPFAVIDKVVKYRLQETSNKPPPNARSRG